MSDQVIKKISQNNFDFLRFLFASLVVFSHSYPLGTGNEDGEPLARFTRGQLTFGSLAVDCFFIISGYLIAHSWMTQPDWRRFLEKRVRRIYPGFIVAVAIGAFVVVPIFSTIEPVSSTLSFMPEFFGKTLRLLQATPGQAFQGNPAPGTVNGSLWSISYEFWCYIGIIIFGKLGIFRWPSLLASGVVASIFISFAFVWFRFNPSGSWLGVILGYPPFWARLLPYFGVGMAFYALRERIPLTTKGAAFSIIIFVLASLIPYSLIFVLPVAAAYMIFWFAFVPLVPLHRFSRYGDFSYGIYLYSFPVLQIVVYLYDGQMNPLLLFAIGWPLSVAAGAMSWHLVERHWLRSGSPTERSRFIRASR